MISDHYRVVAATGCSGANGSAVAWGAATAVWFLGCFWMFSRSSLTGGVVKQCSDQCPMIICSLAKSCGCLIPEVRYIRFKFFRLSMGCGHRESSNGLVDIHLFKVKHTNENMWFWKFKRPPTSVFTYQTTNHNQPINQASNQASHQLRGLRDSQGAVWSTRFCLTVPKPGQGMSPHCVASRNV